MEGGCSFASISRTGNTEFSADGLRHDPGNVSVGTTPFPVRIDVSTRLEHGLYLQSTLKCIEMKILIYFL